MARKSKRVQSTAIATTEAKPNAAAVADVFLWIVQGQTERDFLQALEQHFPASKPEPIIAAALKQLVQSADFDPTLIRGWCFEAYRDLYRRMVDVGDLAGALRAVRALEEMAG